MIVMPADHVIEPAEAFRATVSAAVSVVDDDPAALVTFGIKPTHPETGYGYIERGPLLETRGGIPVYRVIQFREKPDQATAEQFLAAGNFVWNSGIFVWRARTILDELKKHRPTLATALEPILAAPRHQPRPRHSRGSFLHSSEYRSTRPSWSTPPKYGSSRYPISGTTSATGERSPHSSNATQPATRSRAHVVARDTSNSIIISDDGGLIATLGVDDLVVVHSGKATLVARKDQLDKLKALVEGLVQAGYGSYL